MIVLVTWEAVYWSHGLGGAGQAAGVPVAGRQQAQKGVPQGSP